MEYRAAISACWRSKEVTVNTISRYRTSRQSLLRVRTWKQGIITKIIWWTRLTKIYRIQSTRTLAWTPMVRRTTSTVSSMIKRVCCLGLRWTITITNSIRASVNTSTSPPLAAPAASNRTTITSETPPPLTLAKSKPSTSRPLSKRRRTWRMRCFRAGIRLIMSRGCLRHKTCTIYRHLYWGKLGEKLSFVTRMGKERRGIIHQKYRSRQIFNWIWIIRSWIYRELMSWVVRRKGFIRSWNRRGTGNN